MPNITNSPDELNKVYYGNNASKRVVVKYITADGQPDWYELEGGPYDWGTLNRAAKCLAEAILRDLGGSRATVLCYAQKLMLNVIAIQERKRRLCVTEAMVLDGLGCKAIDDLAEVRG